MRIQRVQKFRRIRHRKIRNMVLFILVLPFSILLVGYLISSTLIVPSMTK